MSTGELTDEEFLAAVSAAKFPGGKFGHRGHLRMAWICLRGQEFDAGLERIRKTVWGFATVLGALDKYHETVTRAWAELLQWAMEQTPEPGTFDALLEAHPELLNPGLLERHYRKETLDSPGAKAGWVPPDLEPLPRRKQPGG